MRRRNVLSELAASQAPEDAQLGKYAFPLKRKNKELPREEDTSVEKQLWEKIGNHLTNSLTPLSKEDALLIQSFLKDGYYKHVFHEPNVEFAYRGMSVPDVWLRDVIGNDFDDSNEGEFKSVFTFKPRAGCSSWTQEHNSAKFFAKLHEHKDVSIILHARVRDNRYAFVQCEDGIYNVSFDKPIMTFEKELIGLFDINVFKIEWKKNKSFFERTKHEKTTSEKDVQFFPF